MLSRIIEAKRKQLLKDKKKLPLSVLEQSPYFTMPCQSLNHAIKQHSPYGIIAEFKRKSPSKGILNADADIIKTTSAYIKSGAIGLSILTETHFFMGSNDDLSRVKKIIPYPILRKDFIIDEYQIVESKSLGADAILLIAACLETNTLHQFHQLARTLGMDVICEIHHEKELNKLPKDDYILGVNNRNLNTMETTIETSLTLSKILPQHVLWLSESGITSAEDINMLQKAGYDGFLIGEHVMQASAPDKALQKLTQPPIEIK